MTMINNVCMACGMACVKASRRIIIGTISSSIDAIGSACKETRLRAAAEIVTLRIEERQVSAARTREKLAGRGVKLLA